MIVKLIKRNAEEWSGVKFYKNCGHTLSSYYTRSGRRYTGLEPEDQERLGTSLKLELHPESSFWDTFGIKLSNEKDFYLIDTSDAWGELRYKFCKNHKRVAQSFKDINPSKDYVLVHEEQEAEIENKRSRLKRKAFAELDKMSPDEMRKALRLYGINASNSTSDMVESTLTRIVEDEPEKFLNIWVNNEDREVSYIIEEAVSKNILRKTNTTYKYGTDVIGYTLEEAVAYLKNPEHRTVRISIMGQLDGKEKLSSSKPIKEKTIVDDDK